MSTLQNNDLIFHPMIREVFFLCKKKGGPVNALRAGNQESMHWPEVPLQPATLSAFCPVGCAASGYPLALHGRQGLSASYGRGLFLVRLVLPRIYLDIFKWFKGALDHRLTRTQFSRTSTLDLLSGDLRRSCRLKVSPLNENIRRLSLPVRLSMNERLFFCTETTSQHRFAFNSCSGAPKPSGIHTTKISIPPVSFKSTDRLKISPINQACQTLCCPASIPGGVGD